MWGGLLEYKRIWQHQKIMRGKGDDDIGAGKRRKAEQRRDLEMEEQNPPGGQSVQRVESAEHLHGVPSDREGIPRIPK